MPLIFILTTLIALFFAVHVVRSGREMYWLFILLMFPGLGSLVYFFAVYLPEMRGSSRVRRVAKEIVNTVDPGRSVRAARDQFTDVPSVQNRLILAKALLVNGEAAEAAEHFTAMRQGLHQDDPAILQGLAEALLLSGQPAEALSALDDLRRAQPDYQSADAHLVYARALDDLDRREEAEAEYRAVAEYYPGAEPHCRLALLLQRSGRQEEARGIFQEIVRRLERAPSHVKVTQRQWLDIAKRQV